MLEDIKIILKSAIYAPSGENCQPWRFKVAENKIFIFNLPERDQSLYSWGQRSSYVAHGALIENIILASKNLGYMTKVQLFPDSSQQDLIAEINLEKITLQKDPLFEYVELRCTNRKPYKAVPLTESQKQSLLNEASVIEAGYFKLIDEKEKVLALSQATCINEKVIFENRSLHDFFFRHINWTKQEDIKKSVGFYLDTLELPPPAKGAFKIIKHWPALNMLNKIGFSKAVAKDNFKTHSSASGHGIIYFSDDSRENFISAGRILERIWLKATQLNLALQPMTGILYLHLRIKAGETAAFSANQITVIEKAYEQIAETFGLKNQTLAMYFRIGTADPPTARSSRLPLVIND
jgi:nitroreductase